MSAPRSTPHSGVPGVPGVQAPQNGRSRGNTSKTKGVLGVPVEPVSPQATPPTAPVEIDPKRPSFGCHQDWFVVGGKQLPPGLYWHGHDKKGDNPEDRRIASPIECLAQTAAEDGSNHGRLLRFIPSSSVKWQEWAMPMRMLGGDGSAVRCALLDRGVVLASGQWRLLERWLSEVPSRKIIAASSTGWHGTEARAFVLPHRTIGDDGVRFQSEALQSGGVDSAGSLEGWRSEVAAPCVGNPVLMFAVSLAFAGPLLLPMRGMSAGGALVHLVGDSSKGKTTALQAAASVWGPPETVRTWRATANGLEGTAAGVTDTVLILDEISESEPNEIGHVVYMLANGQGKQRADKAGGVKRSQRWRIIGLSSGERGLADHMAEGKNRAKAGQEARFFDLPATNRTHGAFDCLHDMPGGRDLADAIKGATARQFGMAGAAFVERIIDNRGDMRSQFEQAKGLSCFATADGVEARAADTFALVGAAGELATEYGLTGWPEGAAMDAAIECFELWRNSRGKGNTEDRQILESVRGFIDAHGGTRFDSLAANGASAGQSRDRAGYFQADPDGRRVYLFTSSGLQAAGGGFNVKRIADALQGAGWLTATGSNGKRSSPIAVDGRKVRLYRVMLPDEVDE